MDAATGYRLYHGDQVAEARLVRLLRSLDLPLDQVASAIAAWQDGDDAAVERLLGSTAGCSTPGSPGCAAPCTGSTTCSPKESTPP